jgi:hypothetical protein
MSRPGCSLLLSISLVVLAGCEEEGEATFVELTNGGAVCLHGEGESENTSYLENAPVDVTVVLNPFVGASSVEATCSIEQDGSTLRISASGGYWTKPAGPSTNEARIVMADCTTEPLAAGTYTIEYSRETTTLVVPSMGMAVQLGTLEGPFDVCGY